MNPTVTQQTPAPAWARWLRTPLLLLATALCLAACGGGDAVEAGAADEANTPTVALPDVPAQAASAPLGTGGGAVQATLQGGTTVRFEAAGEQHLATGSVTIEPLARTRGSELGRFRLAINGGLPQKDAVLDINLDPRVQPLNRTRLLLKVGTAWLPISAPLADARSLRVPLKELAALALSKANLREQPAPAQALGRERIRAQDREEPPARIPLPTVIELEMTVGDLPDNEVAAALQSAMATAFAPSLNRPDAHLLIRVFDAVAGTLAANDPVLNGAARQFRDAVCPQAATAVQEMRDDEGTWAVVFEYHMVEATKWLLITTEMRTLFAPLVPLVAACENTPLDFTAPAQAAVGDFKVRHELKLADLDEVFLDHVRELLALRVPQLLDLEAAIQTLTIDATVLPMVPVQLHRVRWGAWFMCSYTGQQDIHAILLLKLQADPNVAAAADFSTETILDEVETCGLKLQIAPVDDSGEAQYGDESLILHPFMIERAPGASASSRRANLNTGNATALEIPMQLGHALGCPAPMPKSQEVLILEAVPAAGPPTVLARQVAASDGIWLDEPLRLEVARLRELAGPENTSLVLRARREGVGCPGGFPGLEEHTPLAEVTIFFNGLAITNTALPSALPNRLYTEPMRAEGGTAPYEWAATGLPAELYLEPYSGLLFGTPTAEGTYNVRVSVTDAAGVVRSKNLPLRVGVDPRIGLWQGTIEFSVSRNFAGSPPGGPNRWSSEFSGTLAVEMTGLAAANDPTALGRITGRVTGGQDTLAFSGATGGLDQQGQVVPVVIEHCRDVAPTTFISFRDTLDGINLNLQSGVTVVYQNRPSYSCATRGQFPVNITSGAAYLFTQELTVQDNQMVGTREWETPFWAQGGTNRYRLSWNLRR